MIQLTNVSLQRGALRLLHEANMTIHPGQRVGLVGHNGAGKSTLLALITGELTPDAGTFDIPVNWRISQMRQEVDLADLDTQALEYALQGDEALQVVLKALSQAESENDMPALIQLHSQMEEIDGYSAETRAKKLLAGLGFSESQMLQPVNSFSGGWRMRLNLAQAMMCPSDLLLLDEPTNHMDLDTLLWLERWLLQYSGTLVLISHDRAFLDAVVDHVVHIENQQCQQYRGGYTLFENTRAERLQQEQAMFVKQEQKRAHMEAFVERFKAKASKAKQAQSRLKALERMTQTAVLQAHSPFEFVFREKSTISNPLIQVRDADLGFPNASILQAISLSLAPGDRVGLLGFNGAGKTTLIQTLAGDLPLLSGEMLLGVHTRVGYFAQHQMEALDAKASAVEHLQKLAPKEREQVLRDFLGGFGFGGDRCDRKMMQCSGGERARLALALIAWQSPNLLLLDEPTNHLDLEMREALIQALHDFQGAVVLVSHDRHLLQSAVDDFWLVDSGKVEPFQGDLTDYSQWAQSRRGELRNKNRDQPQKNVASASPKPKSPDVTAHKDNDRLVTAGIDPNTAQVEQNTDRQTWHPQSHDTQNASATTQKTKPSADASHATSSPHPEEADKRAQRQWAAQQRLAQAPLKKKMTQLERHMAEMQNQKNELDVQLAEPSLYENDQKTQLLSLLTQQTQMVHDLNVMEADWLQLAEQMEENDISANG